MTVLNEQEEIIFRSTSTFLDYVISEFGAGALTSVAEIVKSRAREEFEKDMNLEGKKPGARL